jgi:hypothetical protein
VPASRSERSALAFKAAAAGVLAPGVIPSGGTASSMRSARSAGMGASSSVAESLRSEWGEATSDLATRPSAPLVGAHA